MPCRRFYDLLTFSFIVPLSHINNQNNLAGLVVGEVPVAVLFAIVQFIQTSCPSRNSESAWYSLRKLFFFACSTHPTYFEKAQSPNSLPIPTSRPEIFIIPC